MKSKFGVKKPDLCIGIIHDTAFWPLSKAYVSKCRIITRRRWNMIHSAFESLWFIFLSSEKILVIRTHPQELHVVKSAPNAHISTHFGAQWGQQKLTKCYLKWQGCSFGSRGLKVWPLGVPKPYRASWYHGLSLLTKSTYCVISWILCKNCGFIHKRKKCWFRQKRCGILWGCSIRF